MSEPVSYKEATPKPLVWQIEPDLFLIDHYFQGFPGLIASYLISDGDELSLIDTGPSTTMETLLCGIRSAGFDPEQVTQIILTHIHLDHAGAAGSLIEHLPRARVLVHRTGAPHMVDPANLLASASRLFREDMERLWGEMLPVPAERIVVLDDEATVRAGGRLLQALYTPGHAYHHLAYYEPETRSVFAGDVAAVRLEDAPYVRPPTMPPELDLDLWYSSVARVRKLQPQRLYLGHFGRASNPTWHLDSVLARLGFLAGWTRAHLAPKEELDTDALAETLREVEREEVMNSTGSDKLAEAYELVVPSRMNLEGLARYLRRRGR